MMTRADRAKQFQPFDAMKGLQEALRDREEKHSRVPRHDISEEQQAKNAAFFAALEKGMRVRLDCYRRFHDVTLCGTVTAVSLPYRCLSLDGEKISFDDIYTIDKDPEA